MLSKVFEGKKVLIFGGTGSLGHVLVEHLIEGIYGKPEKSLFFHAMKPNSILCVWPTANIKKLPMR